MKVEPGEVVRVEFDGLDHDGVVLRHEHGWVTARIVIDVCADYGRLTAALAPVSVVCVREHNVTKIG